MRGSQRQKAAGISRGEFLEKQGWRRRAKRLYLFQSLLQPGEGTGSFQNPAVPPRIRLLSGLGGREKG